jgi:DNA processing protein
VISEYPLGAPPLPENFPRRNRIVSGLSRAVLVIEADTRSGALITARQAAEDHNRPVLAIPGRVDSPQSAGPHKLIREGAALVTNLEEIIEALGPLPHGVEQPSPFSEPAIEGEVPVEHAPNEPAISNVTDQQQVILDQIDGNPIGVETLVERTGLAPQIILQELTLLSLKGSIRRIDGQTYARKRT